MVEILLLGIILLLVIVILLLLLKKGKPDPAVLESSISKALTNSGILEKVGRVEGHVNEIINLHRSIEQMLRVPTQRGAFGEITLEKILSDHLPKEMFGIRKRVLDGKIPDAYINSTVGIICIDSKFPLENYRKMINAEDEGSRERYKNDFLKDVQNHLSKVKSDYVVPHKGSAEFAFAYIPSEGVYWFLVNEAYELLRDFVREGVQVVSPLTLAHKVELIKAGVHAKKISEEAQRIKESLMSLARRFEELDRSWKTFFENHLTRAYNKARDVDQNYKKVRDEFDSIFKLNQP
jgi:DNA recombination protein RmuC